MPSQERKRKGKHDIIHHKLTREAVDRNCLAIFQLSIIRNALGK